MEKCWVCEKPAIFRCSKCMEAVYCSEECRNNAIKYMVGTCTCIEQESVGIQIEFNEKILFEKWRRWPLTPKVIEKIFGSEVARHLEGIPVFVVCQMCKENEEDDTEEYENYVSTSGYKWNDLVNKKKQRIFSTPKGVVILTDAEYDCEGSSEHTPMWEEGDIPASAFTEARRQFRRGNKSMHVRDEYLELLKTNGIIPSKKVQEERNKSYMKELKKREKDVTPSIVRKRSVVEAQTPEVIPPKNKDGYYTKKEEKRDIQRGAPLVVEYNNEGFPDIATIKMSNDELKNVLGEELSKLFSEIPVYSVDLGERPEPETDIDDIYGYHHKDVSIRGAIIVKADLKNRGIYLYTYPCEDETYEYCGSMDYTNVKKRLNTANLAQHLVYEYLRIYGGDIQEVNPTITTTTTTSYTPTLVYEEMDGLTFRERAIVNNTPFYPTDFKEALEKMDIEDLKYAKRNAKKRVLNYAMDETEQVKKDAEYAAKNAEKKYVKHWKRIERVTKPPTIEDVTNITNLKNNIQILVPKRERIEAVQLLTEFLVMDSNIGDMAGIHWRGPPPTAIIDQHKRCLKMVKRQKKKEKKKDIGRKFIIILIPIPTATTKNNKTVYVSMDRWHEFSRDGKALTISLIPPKTSPQNIKSMSSGIDATIAVIYPNGLLAVRLGPDGEVSDITLTKDGIEQALDSFVNDPTGYIKKVGLETGYCSICGRRLTDRISLERGIGPECIKHLKKFQQ